MLHGGGSGENNRVHKIFWLFVNEVESRHLGCGYDECLIAVGGSKL